MVHFRNTEYISSIKEYVSNRYNRQRLTGVKRPIGLTLWPNDERKLGIEVKWLEKHGDGYERPYPTNQVFFAGLGDIGSPLVQVFLSRFEVVLYLLLLVTSNHMVYFGIPVSYSYIEIVCMSSVIDKFEQELKNTNVVEYIQSTKHKSVEISAEKITEMSNRRNTLHKIINVMKQMKLSESIWNKFNHEEIEEIATAFNNVFDHFRSENDGLYQTIQDWEDWADRRPY